MLLMVIRWNSSWFHRLLHRKKLTISMETRVKCIKLYYRVNCTIESEKVIFKKVTSPMKINNLFPHMPIVTLYIHMIFGSMSKNVANSMVKFYVWVIDWSFFWKTIMYKEGTSEQIGEVKRKEVMNQVSSTSCPFTAREFMSFVITDLAWWTL